MFIFEKYRPRRIQEFFFNRDVLEQLIHLSSFDDIPHIIISGAQGAGKKTLVKFFLEALYDEDINDIRKITYHVNSSSTKKEIEVTQSNYHIIIEPTNTNQDKHILQEIIKQYAMHKSLGVFKSKRTFKTIVIYNIENLAVNSQAALRRTMEIYAKTCRFVMICNNLSKLLGPLRSRTRVFCVPLPTELDIKKIIRYIGCCEQMNLKNSDVNFIIKNSEGNLKKAIWLLDTKRLQSSSLITLDEVFAKVVDLIIKSVGDKNISKIFDNEIRPNIYNILITNIKGSIIITSLLDLILVHVSDDRVAMKIIQHASEAEYNLIHGRRDIVHVHYFISGVMHELAKGLIKLKKD